MMSDSKAPATLIACLKFLNRLRSITSANPQENPPTPDSFLFTSQDRKGLKRIEIGILGNIELMRASVEGKVEQLTRSSPGVWNYYPQVSPDGKWVLFGSDRSGIRQIYVSKTDGTMGYPITNMGCGWGATHGHWQPGAINS
jgi:hypothetical protein